MAVQTVESRKGMLFAEASRCLLCDDPTCSRACTAGIDCGRILRAVNFKNVKGARRRLTNPAACQNCPAPCESACRRSALDRPVSIRQTLTELAKEPLVPAEPADEQLLETQQLGVKFKNPFLLSSSVVGSNYEMVARAFEMGWGGVCFKTIGTFVPEEVSPRFGALAKEDSPMIGFKNAEQISDHTLDENLSFLRRLKADYPDRVIIASIMGRDEEEWTLLAKLMEENGADIIELNFSFPQIVGEGMGSDVGTNPELVKAYTAAAKRGTSLPVLAKMTPNITDMTVPAEAAMLAGSDGLAAINTVKSVMNVDLYSFVSEPRIAGSSCVSGYSGKAVKPIALRFISDMASDAALKDHGIRDGIPIPSATAIKDDLAVIRQYRTDDEVGIELLRKQLHRVLHAHAALLFFEVCEHLIERRLDVRRRQLLDIMHRIIQRHMQRTVKAVFEEIFHLVIRIRRPHDQRHASEPQRLRRAGRLHLGFFLRVIFFCCKNNGRAEQTYQRAEKNK